VGKHLARKLGWAFIDTDQAIEKNEGKPVFVIFKEKGEAYFRRVETKALKAACRRGACVVATGGGIILKAENRQCMKKNGMSVYLRVKPVTLWKRLKGGSLKVRPLLNAEQPKAVLANLLNARNRYYREADICVRGDGSPRVVMNLILNKIFKQVLKKDL
jgi:shikimate kinase